MNYILKTIQEDKIIITEQEHKNILRSKTDLITLRNGISIRKNCISAIFPENQIREIEDRRNQQIGILHDGTKVKKHFGQWVLNSGDMPDDKGNYSSVKLDPQYYPEAAMDNVATPQEYLRIQENNLNYYEALDISERVKRIGGKKGLTHIFDK